METGRLTRGPSLLEIIKAKAAAGLDQAAGSRGRVRSRFWIYFETSANGTGVWFCGKEGGQR